MSDDKLNTINKKNAGKGNGNSVINNKNTNNTASDYVSGDATPTSTGHKFGKDIQNKDEESE